MVPTTIWDVDFRNVIKNFIAQRKDILMIQANLGLRPNFGRLRTNLGHMRPSLGRMRTSGSLKYGGFVQSPTSQLHAGEKSH